jgi:zinc protease
VEHLKNPSLAKMYRFYKDYYVANNMALILSGNFDSEQIKPYIQKAFGKLKSGKAPESPDYPIRTFKGRELVKVRITPIKAGFMGYKLVPETHPDRPALDVIGEMMSNYNQTGFIDQMALNNEVIYAGASQNFLQDDGSTFIFFVPKLFGSSLRKFETRIRGDFQKIANGDFSDNYLESIKNTLYKNHKLSLEDLGDRARFMGKAFILDQSWEDMMAYPEKIAALGKADIQNVSAKYYGDNYFVMHSRTGFPRKKKLKKPPYKPIPSRTEASSEYARQFQEIPENEYTPKFINFNEDVSVSENYLFHTYNPLNDIFTLRLSIARGLESDAVLKPLADALDLSGTSKYSPQGLKKEFARLGGSYSTSCDYNSFNLKVTGLDTNLPEILELTQHLLEDFSPTDNTIDLLYNQRVTVDKVNNNDPSTGGYILYLYGLFRDQSYYRSRLSKKELKNLNPKLLKKRLNELLAPGFNSIHYAGQIKQKEIEQFFLANPFFKKNTENKYSFKESTTPEQTTIFLVNDKKAIQSYVYYIVKGEQLNYQDFYKKEAFKAYYTNSLSGLLFQEVRELRSLAYAAMGDYVDPEYEPEKSGRLVLFTGSQADKTVDAVQVVLDLIREMPVYENRISKLREGLMLSSGSTKPDFRQISTQLEIYLKTGFKEDPNESAFKHYPDLQFGDIQSFYDDSIKGKPIIVTIYGDVSQMDMERLRSLGTVVTLKMDDIMTE